MGLFKMLKDAFSDPPPGPVYSVGDLEFHVEQFERHVDECYDLVMANLPEDAALNALHAMKKRRSEQVKDPIHLIAWAKYKSLPCVTSWVRGYISDIREYRINGRPELRSTAGIHAEIPVFRKDLDGVKDHVDAIRKHKAEIINAINFFVCDFRSTFDSKAAYEAKIGPSGCLERCRYSFDARSNIENATEHICTYFTRAVEIIRGAE